MTTPHMPQLTRPLVSDVLIYQPPAAPTTAQHVNRNNYQQLCEQWPGNLALQAWIMERLVAAETRDHRLEHPAKTVEYVMERLETAQGRFLTTSYPDHPAEDDNDHHHTHDTAADNMLLSTAAAVSSFQWYEADTDVVLRFVHEQVQSRRANCAPQQQTTTTTTTTTRPAKRKYNTSKRWQNKIAAAKKLKTTTTTTTTATTTKPTTKEEEDADHNNDYSLCCLEPMHDYISAYGTPMYSIGLNRRRATPSPEYNHHHNTTTETTLTKDPPEIKDDNDSITSLSQSSSHMEDSKRNNNHRKPAATRRVRGSSVVPPTAGDDEPARHNNSKNDNNNKEDAVTSRRKVPAPRPPPTSSRAATKIKAPPKKVSAKSLKRNECALPKGVTQRASGKWQAQVYFAGASRYVGVFPSSRDAALAFGYFKEYLLPFKEGAAFGQFNKEELSHLIEQGRQFAMNETSKYHAAGEKADQPLLPTDDTTTTTDPDDKYRILRKPDPWN